MSKDKQTAVEWLEKNMCEHIEYKPTLEIQRIRKKIQQAKEMEKEQIGYTKADVIKAGEMGEINYLDTLHITTYLNEAKKFNETYGGNK
jgi:hypothetical protein